ncbi:cytochrome P450 [Allokutzneria oryzae]|uniref:Cytochrome P450 n=1 Tax=Allokutzneria oryzae TaxID=1378989 RepID=A0ABV5ZTV5_9PSEU
MGLARELRLGAKMLGMRATVRALAATGDPVAKVLGLRALDDPYPLYERIRERGDLSRHPLGLYLTAKHSVVSSVLRDSRFRVEPAVDHVGVDWNVHPGDETRLRHPMEHSLLTMNPPRHTELRALVAPWFTPRALRDREESIERIVDEFLDHAVYRASFDLVSDFAVRVPTKVVCDLFGIPDDRHADFSRWGSVLAGTLDGIRTLGERHAVRRALSEMTAFFDDLILLRRKRPGDDVISGLVRAELAGEPLHRDDVVALAGLLFVAGYETTVNLIGGGTLNLLNDPAQKQRMLDDPSTARGVVEEVLRVEPPVQFALRFTREPLSLCGKELPADTPVVLLLAGANRDPEVFTDPHRFDAARPNSREHLSFSAGIHFCLGAGLARMEAEIALRRLFQRIPGLSLAGPVRYKRTRNIRGMTTMPVSARLIPVR